MEFTSLIPIKRFLFWDATFTWFHTLGWLNSKVVFEGGEALITFVCCSKMPTLCGEVCDYMHAYTRLYPLVNLIASQCTCVCVCSPDIKFLLILDECLWSRTAWYISALCLYKCYQAFTWRCGARAAPRLSEINLFAAPSIALGSLFQTVARRWFT